MAEGPSPFVPFLLVATLGLLLHGHSLMNNISILSDSEDTIFSFVLVIPLLVLLLVYYTSQSIIAPLALLLIMYTVTKVFLGPLILIAIIYLASVYTSSMQIYGYKNQVYSERDGFEAWGCLLLLLVFLTLHCMLAEGEGQKWGITLLVMLFYVLYNLSY